MRKPGPAPFYSSPEELQVKIDDYFNNPPFTHKMYVEGMSEPVEVPIYTITGLVLHCGFCDRQSFYDYEKREMFSHTIKKARARIEQVYENLLHRGNCTGAIFALKNFGWRDKHEVEQTGSFNIMGEITKNGKPLKFNVGEEIKDEG